MKARVLVRLKEGILDVQGATVKRALAGLGFPEVRDVRVGKVLEFDIEGDSAEATRQRIEEMCAKLLANPVTEDFTVEVVTPR
jgi:phosphoribosylformylglycinamidine synthase PurS subunit